MTASIDVNVAHTSPGAYALGRASNDTFYVDYVGRADVDVAARLKQWLATKKYTHFKFEYYSSPKAAFEKECRLYHDWKPQGLDNEIHPDRPNGTDWKCPICEPSGLLGLGRGLGFGRLL